MLRQAQEQAQKMISQSRATEVKTHRSNSDSFKTPEGKTTAYRKINSGPQSASPSPGTVAEQSPASTGSSCRKQFSLKRFWGGGESTDHKPVMELAWGSKRRQKSKAQLEAEQLKAEYEQKLASIKPQHEQDEVTQLGSRKEESLEEDQELKSKQFCRSTEDSSEARKATGDKLQSHLEKGR